MCEEDTCAIQAATLMLTASHESNLLTAWNKMTMFTLNERLDRRFELQEQYQRTNKVIIPQFYNLHRICVQ
jgi:hypothetical protein